MNGRIVLILLCSSLILVSGVHRTLHPLPAEQYVLDSDATVVEKTIANIQYRLPNNTRPLAYDIQLTTNVHRADFAVTGQVRITVVVQSPGTRSITLHHRQLTIGATRLLEANGETAIPVSTPVYTENNEHLTVSLVDDTQVADLVVDRHYVLEIRFNSTLREDLTGFYRASYLSDNGSIRWLAGTHFEPTDARHGFPCFDEPGLRATFKLSITHGSEYFALSNMPVFSITPLANTQMQTTVFEETPSMPTYLMAYVVSDFVSTSHKHTKTGFVQRVFAPSNVIETGAFGLETGVNITDAFEKHFNVNYSLPKLDQVAIPDFGGAMENWGLIIYDYEHLLFNRTEDLFAIKMQVASTIIHEYAHQWFGNIVTNKWWSYTWLNEGFAKLYEFHGTSWLFPDWNYMDFFVYAIQQTVMVHDATNFTRPMTHYVESPSDIFGNFDTISYQKAGSVLNMFLHAFTEEKFTSGLTVYLNRHAFDVVEEKDLFAALQETVIGNESVTQGFTVANVMSSWTRQSGFPLVTAVRNYTSGTVKLQQSRYLSDPNAALDSSTWWVPYNLATASEARFNETHAEGWLAPNTVSVEFPVANADWLLLNKRQTGYYRVMYDEQNYQLLTDALIRDVNVIHLASRSQLVDDLFDLAQSERLSYGTVFDMVKYLEHEVEYVPWLSAWRGLTTVDALQSGSASFGKYKSYIVKLLTKFYMKTDLTTEVILHRRQALALRWSCQYGGAKCLSDMNTRLRDVLAGNDTIHANHRMTVICAGTRAATDEQYELIWARFQSETNENVRNGWIDALACSAQVTQLRSVLERSLNATFGVWLSNERFRLFSAVANNREGLVEALDLLTGRWDKALETYGVVNVNAAIEQLASHINNAALGTRFAALVEKAKESDKIQENTILKAMQIIYKNDRWINRNQKIIEDWIEKNGSTSAVVSSVLMLACTTLLYIYN